MRFAPVAATGTTRRARSDMMLGGHFIPMSACSASPYQECLDSVRLMSVLLQQLEVATVQEACML